VHPLVAIHNAAVYEKALCRLLELETLPILDTLQAKQKHNKAKVFISQKIVLTQDSSIT
jgi:hypothetical protein